jgi:hypothetical protein
MEEEMRQRLILLVMSAGAVAPALGSTVMAPNLGTASPFGLLGDTISNTGVSNVVGNVGAKTTITGFPPGTATGIVYPFPSDPTVAQAYLDFVSAYNLALLDPSTQTVTDLTMSRLFLGNNVFTFPLTDVVTTPNITLTFDAQGDSSEVFIIEIARDLTVNGPITFMLQNGALASNIFWIVGRTETINPVGVPVTWDGSILAGTSFTMSSIGPSSALAGTVNGCVFAETANTLAGKTQVNGCSGATSIPEPESSGLVILGGLLGILAFRKFPVERHVKTG